MNPNGIWLRFLADVVKTEKLDKCMINLDVESINLMNKDLLHIIDYVNKGNFRFE
jgi:hypothetical protein